MEHRLSVALFTSAEKWLAEEAKTTKQRQVGGRAGEHQAHALWVNPGLALTQDIERAGMKSFLLTADWQFQSPTENKRFAG